MTMPAAAARSMYSTAPMTAAVLSRDELLARLEASEEGLTSSEARRRLDRVGLNEPAGPRRGAVVRELLGFLTNPLVLILILASVVSAVLGDTVNAAIIALMVVLSVVLNFVQAYRSQRAAEGSARRRRPRPPSGGTGRGPSFLAVFSSPATS